MYMSLEQCKREEIVCDAKLGMHMQSRKLQILTMAKVPTEYCLSPYINFSQKQVQAGCLHFGVADPLKSVWNL